MSKYCRTGKINYSDKYIIALWRQAVLKQHYNSCVICGNGNIYELECHHIIKRRYKLLRYDWQNGVPLCNSHTESKCHIQADTPSGMSKIIFEIGNKRCDYLSLRKNILYKDYLRDNSLNDKEFKKLMVEELKNIINGG